MKRFLIFICFCQVYQVLFSQSDLLFLTYNIRYNNPGDGHSAWPHRKLIMLDSLNQLNGTIYCFQEVLDEQYQDLKSGLPRYESYGIGRDNGKSKGEMAPIFYKKSEWICINKGTFWLSETPEKPSKGWDAGLPRIVSWVQLEQVSTAKKLFVFNTHFDHKGKEARIQSGILLAQKVKEMAGEELFVIAGDLNLTSDHPSYQELIKISADSRKAAENIRGTDYSFAGFDVNNPPFPLHRIDYLFVSGSIKVKEYDCPDWKQDAAHWLSDHRPVLAKIQQFTN